MKKEIATADILNTATAIVSAAKTSICMTMSAAEEIAHKLPSAYFDLLHTKLEDGVRISRVGFGTEEEFAAIRDDVQVPHSGYSFHLTKSLDYRRMLLVDGTQLMFVENDETGRHVYLSTDPADVDRCTQYFQQSLLK